MTTAKERVVRSIRSVDTTVEVETCGSEVKLIIGLDTIALGVRLNGPSIDWIVRALTEAKAEMEAAK
jgi:hypothetical protein